MLIFLWHIPEAFVLTEEINAAPDKCGSLLLCGHAPHQPGGSQAVLIPSSAFLLKLDPEARNGMEDPTKQLEMPPLLLTKGDMESC